MSLNISSNCDINFICFTVSSVDKLFLEIYPVPLRLSKPKVDFELSYKLCENAIVYSNTMYQLVAHYKVRLPTFTEDI